MKIIFKDFQGNDIYTAEITTSNNDTMIVQAIPPNQPRNQMEAINQLMEQANSIFPRMMISTIANDIDTKKEEVK